MKTMPATAKLNHLRIAPRKVRLVADAIRGKSLAEARDVLNFTVKKASKPIRKLLESAVKNATNNEDMEESLLYIKEIKVNEGPSLKRWRPRARGRADVMQKRTSHVEIVLEEK